MNGKRHKVQVSVGVFVHNEERNVQRVLRSLEKQKLHQVTVKEIIVISSGSNDGTNAWVRGWIGKGKGRRMIEEVVRSGKAAAINRLLRTASAEVVVTVSGDLRLHPKALEEIGQPFLNEDVGMVGARPKPDNSRFSEIGRENSLLWELHHHISMIQPKCGEMVAFRNVIRQIPRESAVDEATLEVLLKMVGYGVLYAPRAVVYNKGPKNFREYLTQRRRVFAGHQWVANRYNYQVVTMQPGLLVRVMLMHLMNKPNDIWPMVRLAGMELVARMLGWMDYHVFERNPFVWKMISR